MTVDTDSFERMSGQLGGNIAENVISCKLSQLSKWNSTNISVLMCTTTVQNFNLICCAFVIEMYESTLVNFSVVFLRTVFRQITRGTVSLLNDNSSTNRAWKLSLAPLESPYNCLSRGTFISTCNFQTYS